MGLDPLALAAGACSFAATVLLLLGLRAWRRGHSTAWGRALLSAGGEAAPGPAGRWRLPAWARHLRPPARRPLPPWARRDHLLLVGLAGGAAGIAAAYAVTGLAHLALAGAVLGFLAPRWWLGWMAAGREREALRQLEQALERMSAAVRAGGGPLQALDAARGLPPPLGPELELAAREARVGLGLGAVFQRLAERLGAEDASFVAAAVALQEEAGVAVNLAAVLDHAQQSLRERRLFRERARALTAEGRVQALAVGLIPFAVVGMLRAGAPEFVAPLFHTAWGQALLAGCAAVIVLGIRWVYRIADVEG